MGAEEEAEEGADLWILHRQLNLKSNMSIMTTSPMLVEVDEEGVVEEVVMVVNVARYRIDRQRPNLCLLDTLPMQELAKYLVQRLLHHLVLNGPNARHAPKWRALLLTGIYRISSNGTQIRIHL